MTFYIFSCKKEKNNNANVKPAANYNVAASKIANDLRLINARHTHTGLSGAKTTSWSIGKWCLVISADATGAIAGAQAGGKLGAIIGTAVNPGAGTAAAAGLGAGIGAGILGTLASYGAANAGSMLAPNGGGYSNQIIEMSMNFTVANPYSNPYDYVGSRHNVLLQQLVINFPNTSPATSSNLFNNITLSDEETYYLSNDASNTLMGSFSTFMAETPDFTQFISGTFTDTTDTIPNSVMNLFLAGLSICAQSENWTIDSTIAFINSYEQYFVNNQNVSTFDDNELLTSFSVAKYSSVLWYNAMN